MRERGRAAIYLLAGVYLLYLTYSMFRDMGNSTGGEYVIMVVFLILFAVIGLGLIGFAIYLNYMYSRKPKADTETVSQTDSQDTKVKEITEENSTEGFAKDEE